MKNKMNKWGGPVIKAIVFDAYGTLFNVHSIQKTCNKLFPGIGEEISQLWRKKQLEYFFLSQLFETYKPFSKITKDALHFACEANGHKLTKKDEDVLLKAYLDLELFPEVEKVLNELTDKKELVIFSNGSHDMIDPLIKKSKIAKLITMNISADDVKQYKPTPNSYKHCLTCLSFKKEEILFVSSNNWDVLGAKSFGFKTAWINRENAQQDQLDIKPDVTYNDLFGILEWN